MLSRPDVLVLGGGGVLGEEWMTGVLAGVEDATGFDMRRCEYFVGTSAGSIIAARLTAGRGLRRPDAPGTEIERAEPVELDTFATASLSALRCAGEWTFAAWAPLAPYVLAATGPAGAVARAAMLRRIPRPTRTLTDLRLHIEGVAPRFDGRLRITTVDRERGRRVVFGSPGAPYATVAQAVEASCSVPWLFAPVSIGGREYVDGGVWSATNLDVAPAGRDTHVLCLNPMAGINGAHTLVQLARRAARSAVSVESLALRRRGAIIHVVQPDLDAAAVMGADFMDPEPRPQVLAAGYQQGLRLAMGR